MRWNVKIPRNLRLYRWHRWFAWYPVKCRIAQKWAWLETVMASRNCWLDWDYKPLQEESLCKSERLTLPVTPYGGDAGIF